MEEINVNKILQKYKNIKFFNIDITENVQDQDKKDYYIESMDKIHLYLLDNIILSLFKDIENQKFIDKNTLYYSFNQSIMNYGYTVTFEEFNSIFFRYLLINYSDALLHQNKEAFIIQLCPKFLPTLLKIDSSTFMNVIFSNINNFEFSEYQKKSFISLVLSNVDKNIEISKTKQTLFNSIKKMLPDVSFIENGHEEYGKIIVMDQLCQNLFKHIILNQKQIYLNSTYLPPHEILVEYVFRHYKEVIPEVENLLEESLEKRMTREYFRKALLRVLLEMFSSSMIHQNYYDLLPFIHFFLDETKNVTSDTFLDFFFGEFLEEELSYKIRNNVIAEISKNNYNNMNNLLKKIHYIKSIKNLFEN